MNKKQYFTGLAEYAKELFDTLPIELEPKPLSYSLGILRPKVDSIKEIEIQKLELLRANQQGIATWGNTNSWQGLNSIGMLMDRFTILLIREWSLRNKINKNVAKADAIYQEQTLDIIDAMVHAAPGSASMNSKITNIKGDVAVEKW